MCKCRNAAEISEKVKSDDRISELHEYSSFSQPKLNHNKTSISTVATLNTTQSHTQILR